MSKFFLTTAIAYVNGAPHLGHALEFIHADAVARYRRQRGDAVHFLTGTDEHGVKIVKTAAELGLPVRAFVDGNAQKYVDLKQTFELSWDDFIRTTDQKRHWPAVQKLWSKLVAAGDLYEKEYEGLYCSGCEAFLAEKDLLDGKCPVHARPPEVVKEKNWFFRLSKYSDAILKKLESREVAIVPEFRAKEFINVVRDGLHDVSFSRPVDSLKGWGIPVPGDDSQLMYVWCDALTNYISAVGYGAVSDEEFLRLGNTTPDSTTSRHPLQPEGFGGGWWPVDVHAIGKDIVRFHAGIWLGMLLSADLPLPKQIYVHGFVTSEGQKMSKSLGNVVDPVTTASEWGVDALRWYLLSEIPNGQDGDFSQLRFKEKYNAELANALGNLVSRVIAMALKVGETFPLATLDDVGRVESEKMWVNLDRAMGEYDARSATLAILELITWANKYVDETKPWALAKTDAARHVVVLGTLLEVIRQIALALSPFLPTAAAKIAATLGVTLDGHFADVQKWRAIPKFHLTKPEILFPKKD